MISNKFFTAEEIAPKTWRITNCFDSHEQMMTYCYLLEGSEKALLIDTMFGFGNLKSFCRELTDLPIVLVNTHYHGDHAGGNYDFDECYLHVDDIPYIQEFTKYTKDVSAYLKEGFESMKRAALPEFKDMVQPTDISTPHPMAVWPVYDGEAFQLGGRLVEVIHVGGHSAGEIVLLDRSTRICFTGDACNSNTLLMLEGSLSIEEHLEFLRHFKTFQGEFDHCHGGHEDFDTSVIDDGIAMCQRILEGTDEHEETNFFGMDCVYGAVRATNGHRYNVGYLPDHLHKKEKQPRVL